MYNNFSNYGSSSFGNVQSSQSSQGVSSQYQGYQKQYKPVGFVQSFYGQNTTQAQGQGFGQGFGQPTSPESFHAANYRGNQIGHDAYRRSDSSTPSQSSFQGGYSSYSAISNPQFGTNQAQFGFQTNPPQFAGSQWGGTAQTNQPYTQQAVSPNAFHAANYRGNQIGHDTYLRSDSTTPTQSSYQTQSGYGTQTIPQGISQGVSQGISSFNTGFNQYGQAGQFGYNS